MEQHELVVLPQERPDKVPWRPTGGFLEAQT